ncbi:small subunit processome component 20 homolog isoform X1 [Dysidea avara]|uniref:small subunit processome component 20 homolog isoform X1 n=1 Tax=Dysidea avara TaxID=196820 RepID=UPI00331D56B1
MLNSNLSGLLLKVCHTVRSYQMRCLREMKEVLTKGYKVQVLSYSIHVLLNRVKDQLTAGNLDVTISEVLVWCGVAAEERREGEITLSKLPEARAS